MAFSLEARSPLLDHEFMELAASLPVEHKASGGERKIALKRALRGWVPDPILDGRKQGFQLPVGNWLRTDLAPFAREVLLDRQSAERGWLRPAEVEALIDRHVAGSADNSDKLWSLLVLELWADSLDDPAPEPAGAGPRGEARPAGAA
jgi:asparagine synthase (glutamine-hydrolysing)